MQYICKSFFVNNCNLAVRLPFQDKIDIWDIEYALKQLKEEEGIAALGRRFIDVKQTRITYGDEETQAFIIIDGGRPYTLPRRSVVENYDYDDEERDTSRDGIISLTYNAVEIRRRNVRRQFSFHINDLLDLTNEQIKAEIDEAIAIGRYTDLHLTATDVEATNQNRTFSTWEGMDTDEDTADVDFSYDDAQLAFNTIIHSLSVTH